MAARKKRSMRSSMKRALPTLERRWSVRKRVMASSQPAASPCERTVAPGSSRSRRRILRRSSCRSLPESLRQVLVPGLGQRQHRTAVLPLHRGPQPVGRRERGQDGGGGRRGADAVQVPLAGLAGAVLQQRLPHLLFASGRHDQVEVVGDVHPADDPLPSRPVLVERQHADQAAVGIRRGQDLLGAVRREGATPLGLPLPGEKQRGQARAVEQGVPAALVQGREAAAARRPSRRQLPASSPPPPGSIERAIVLPGPRRPRPSPRPWPRRGPRRGPPPSRGPSS